MPLIALTGGIASGKSTIARRLAEHGAVVVDADRTVRELQEPGRPVFEQIVDAFGPGVVAPDGSLNRPALGSIVFDDPDKLATLNAIVHPAVRDETQRRFREAFAADPDAVVVYDVPLLREARGTGEWDRIVVAHAPAAVRIERMVVDRGMTRDDAAARVRNQASDEDRLALADVVIDTSGTIEHTLEQADRLWDDLRAN
ncbi:dephospho-CoA kinase [Microbacterium nanhaiense]|uniref:Dephospho-CoA kinase n=1 Tax=Microbacterium nanhaiense TaxID=1301026 RepID=A0ABQ2MZH4_9MICO|nr:dephospho-CoA kinase [Microbacterium nanhaiense]GGO61035.1 dephospho-CoA kinase [Microbacterium nanhaiense]